MKQTPLLVKRQLVVNADDLGQSPGINEGILQCHDRGIVTSASLMVRWPFSSAAAAIARRRPALGVGLHLDLGEWSCRHGDWHALYQVVPLDDANAIGAEIDRQLETFRTLMRRDPTHIDSHQHVHTTEPARALVLALAARLGVPCRRCDDQVAYHGEFYGQTRNGEALDGAISVEALTSLLTALPAGASELCCHPGLRNDAPGMYVEEREREARVLCDPVVRDVIEGEQIELVSYRELVSRTASTS